MDKQLIEKIAREVACEVDPAGRYLPYPSTTAEFAAAFLARIDAERGKEAVAWFAFADSNGPVPLELWGFDQKACKYAVLENARSVGWEGTIEGYLFQKGWTIRPLVFADPQPPTLCPKCAELKRLHGESPIESFRIIDALQAKVAELELYVGNLLARIHRDGGHYQAEHGNLKATRDADLIVAKLNAQSDEQSAEIARLKTVPMKYRRMEFNAQLQDENKQQAELIEQCEAEFFHIKKVCLSEFGLSLVNENVLSAIAEHKKGGA